ncbi:hypothetical protein Tco_1111877 [Tanacetum coccineum]|uniref:Uncharacterized protein n=1 Tax=Tanacetum coccineum TaxID=301880 RepID=A0ABQ5IMV2_9ASTR
MSMWDAEFYNKVDDNVDVNIVSQFRSLTSFILFAATLGHTLVRHKKKKKGYLNVLSSGFAEVVELWLQYGYHISNLN